MINLNEIEDAARVAGDDDVMHLVALARRQEEELKSAQQIAQAANRQAEATVEGVLNEMQPGGALYQPPSAMDEQRILEIAKRMPRRPWGIGSRCEDAIAFAWEVIKAAPQQHAQAAMSDGLPPLPRATCGDHSYSGADMQAYGRACIATRQPAPTEQQLQTMRQSSFDAGKAYGELGAPVAAAVQGAAVPAQTGMQGDGRSDFELWAKSRFFDVTIGPDGKNYLSGYTQGVWEPWQAAVAQRAASQDSERDAALIRDADTVLAELAARCSSYDPERDYGGSMELRDQYRDGDYFKVDEVQAVIRALAAQPKKG